MIQTLKKNVHCNIFFQQCNKKPKYPSRTLGQIPKNNLYYLDIPTIYLNKM